MSDISQNDSRQLVLLLFVVRVRRGPRPLRRPRPEPSIAVLRRTVVAAVVVRSSRWTVTSTLRRRRRRRAFSRRKMSIGNFDVPDIFAAEIKNYLLTLPWSWLLPVAVVRLQDEDLGLIL